MAYNYLRYSIVCPHLQLFNQKINCPLSFKQQKVVFVPAAGNA